MEKKKKTFKFTHPQTCVFPQKSRTKDGEPIISKGGSLQLVWDD